MRKLAAKFDEYIVKDDFAQMIAFLVSTPNKKLACYYIYTIFFMGLRRGHRHRRCIRYLKFWYYLKYSILITHIKNWICG